MGAGSRVGIAAAGVAGALIIMRAKNAATEECAWGGLRGLLFELTFCRGVAEALAAIERAFVTTFQFPLAVLTSAGDQLRIRHNSRGVTPDDGDVAGARSAISCGATVRRSHRDGGATYYVPLTTWSGAVGAFCFRARRRIRANEWPVIESFAHQTSLSVLRGAFEHEARHANLLSEADRFQKALLNSIAHNVRTPLASVIGVLSSLQEDHAMLNPAVRGELVATAREEAERLNRLLGNLLDLSRLESGAVHVRADLCDVQDVIGAALEQLGDAARKRPIVVTLAPGLPLVRLDFVLIVQVLVNVLDNAFKYSPPDTPIAVEARAPAGALEIRISDEGDGIPERDLVNVFEKFNRAGRTGETGGIGLGLSICRGLIEAHKGTIRAERRAPRGTAVTFTLPLRSVEQKQ